MSVRKGGKVIAGNVSHYNIGDTFMTRRTDTNLAGAVGCDGATYNTTDFTGDGSIGELLESGKLDYVSLSAYSTAISTKGWCDKIGWDGTGTTAFRVPTLNAHIVQTNNIPVVGNGENFVLERLSGQTGVNGVSINATTGNVQRIAAGGLDGPAAFSTDPTKSGLIADTTDTAQLRVMIQLFNSTTDEAVATVGGVLADVAGLKDMSNITATGKETVVGWGMPNYTAGVQITTTAQTAPKNGWLIGFIYNSGNNTNTEVFINNINVAVGCFVVGQQWGVVSLCIPIKAGQSFKYVCYGTMERNSLYFYPNNE